MARPRGAFEKGKQWTLVKIQSLGSRVWATNEYLAKEYGCSVWQMRRYVRELRDDGVIRQTLKSYRKNGQPKTRRFLYPAKNDDGTPRAFFGVPLYPELNPPLDTSVDPEVQRALDEFDADEKLRIEREADPEYRYELARKSALRYQMHEALGGFSRPVRHSPHVQAMLDEAEKQENK